MVSQGLPRLKGQWSLPRPELLHEEQAGSRATPVHQAFLPLLSPPLSDASPEVLRTWRSSHGPVLVGSSGPPLCLLRVFSAAQSRPASRGAATPAPRPAGRLHERVPQDAGLGPEPSGLQGSPLPEGGPQVFKVSLRQARVAHRTLRHRASRSLCHVVVATAARLCNQKCRPRSPSSPTHSGEEGLRPRPWGSA